jgi:hypothetical protein
MIKQMLLAAAFCFSITTLAQVRCVDLLPDAKKRLRENIGYLASDELEGRAPGTKGIKLAAQHILKEFKVLQLSPYVGDDFRQEFDISVAVEFTPQNGLAINGKPLEINEDFYPTQHSSNGMAEGEAVYVKYGITAPEKKYDDYKKLKPAKLSGKIFVMDVSSPDGIHFHSEYLKYHDLGERIALAKQKGAAGVVLVNLEGSANDLPNEFKNIHGKGIPVVFITNNSLATKAKKAKQLTLVTELKAKTVKAYNLVAYLDNNAEQTIVVGAHYDHLGMGGSSSMAADKEPQIHNGADDNASGVAGMLEIARNIAGGDDEYKKYNYIFIAFSGEEMGLLGSAYFTKNADRMAGRVKYMINLDMIGRMEDGMVEVSGVGTSSAWEPILNEIECQGVKVKTSASGVGPSDHTNFYYLDMPVLHFFTGTHMDYHKPSDDADKINYKGEEMVIQYILSLILNSMDHVEMEFTPTSEQSQMAPRFSVTLGVMPDYMYEGEGMHIDGVTQGRAADKAGLLAGDVVTKLGDVKVVDMMSYMKALSQFKKGDEVPIEYLRAGEKMTGKVKF